MILAAVDRRLFAGAHLRQQRGGCGQPVEIELGAEHAGEDRRVLGFALQPRISFIGSGARRARRAQFGEFRLRLHATRRWRRRQDECGVEVPRIKQRCHLRRGSRRNAERHGGDKGPLHQKVNVTWPVIARPGW
ncbi:hypothetical protein D9M73_123540 [compost metagenome]